MISKYKIHILFSKAIAAAILLSICGCGYTTGSLLPAHIKNIYVEDFKNKIPIAQEVSEQNRYKTYRPLLEVDITEAIIDRFLFDGNLRVTSRKEADIILEGALVDFRREPTQYGYDDSVEQYRIAIFVDMKAIDTASGKPMWTENSFAGSDYYYTSGPEAESEDTAVTDAISDLARRVVERTIEIW
jgi:hypothetical protein